MNSHRSIDTVVRMNVTHGLDELCTEHLSVDIAADWIGLACWRSFTDAAYTHLQTRQNNGVDEQRQSSDRAV